MSAALTDHAADEDLARFASAPDPAAQEFATLREHLATGCTHCALQLAVHRRDWIESPFAPPVWAEWIVPRRIAHPSRQRAGVLADYELLCGVGDYELDVIVRELDLPRRLDIGGQVTQAMALHDPARDVPLFLVEAQGDGVVSATCTDEFGEFDFSAVNGSRYGIRVGGEAGAPCVLVWDGVQ